MKYTILEQIQLDGSIKEFVLIDHGNEQFTSMPKSVYDTLASESQAPAAPTA